MTATTTWDPAAGNTITYSSPPAALLMGLVRDTVAPPVMKTGMPAIGAQAPAQRLLLMVTVFPIPTKLSRAIGGLTCALAAG